MGWSSWSSLRGSISEAAIEAQADVMHSKLQRYGYQYVNVDAGWSDHLDGYGRDAWDTTKFPNGIAHFSGDAGGINIGAKQNYRMGAESKQVQLGLGIGLYSQIARVRDHTNHRNLIGMGTKNTEQNA